MNIQDFKSVTDSIHDDIDDVIDSLADKLNGDYTDEEKLAIEALSNLGYTMQFSFSKVRDALIKTRKDFERINKSEK